MKPVVQTTVPLCRISPRERAEREMRQDLGLDTAYSGAPEGIARFLHQTGMVLDGITGGLLAPERKSLRYRLDDLRRRVREVEQYTDGFADALKNATPFLIAPKPPASPRRRRAGNA